MIKNFIVLIICLYLSGCSPSILQISEPENKEENSYYTNTGNSYFWGLTGNETLEAYKICGKKGINSIETHDATLNGFLNFITGGIYIPVSYSVYCNK